MSLFVFPLLGYHLTGSTAVAALLEAAGLLGMVAMLLPAGVLADRFDRRALMLAASASGAVLYGSLALAGALGVLTVPHLAAVALLTGVAQGVFQPAQMAAIRTVVSTEELPTAFSQNQARQHVASLLGGPLGGALYAVRSWAPFVVDFVSYGVSLFTLSRIRTDLRPQPREGAPTRPMEQVKEGYRFIRERPFFRTLMVWATLNNLVVNACFFVVMMLLVRAGVQPARIGLVSTVRRPRWHPRRPGRAVRHRADADRHPDRRRRLDVRPAAGAAGVVVDADGCVHRGVPGPPAQPGRQRGHRRLPCGDDPRRPAGPGGLGARRS